MHGNYIYIFKCNCALDEFPDRPTLIKQIHMHFESEKKAIMSAESVKDGYIDNYLYVNVELIDIVRPDGSLLTSGTINGFLSDVYREGIEEGIKRERRRQAYE